MTAEERKKRDINWTPVVIGGAALGGLYLVWRIMETIQHGSEADRKLAREIMADWQDEFEHMKEYSELIYWEGRVPEEHETAILSAMLGNMQIKEETVYELSKSVWKEMGELIETTAENWWLAPAIGLAWVPGYAAYKVVKRWKDRRQPPPNFPCARCDFVGGTEGALRHHFDTTHIDYVSLAGATEAQVEFYKLDTWVQASIAVESHYGRTYTNWASYTVGELQTLTWGIMNTYAYGIAALAQLSTLWTMVFALTPF